jgi:hypothetical protein
LIVHLCKCICWSYRIMKVILESPLEIEECKRRLRNSLAQPFRFGDGSKNLVYATLLGKHGSLVIRKYLFPGFGFNNYFFPGCTYSLKENGQRTTVYLKIGTQPFGIAILLIIIGVGIFMITQFIRAEDLDSLIIIIIMFAGCLAILLGGRIKDAPNALIGFMKSTLDIDDSNVNL